MKPTPTRVLLALLAACAIVVGTLVVPAIAGGSSPGMLPFARIGGGGVSLGLADTRYLKLDASNDPVTGILNLGDVLEQAHDGTAAAPSISLEDSGEGSDTGFYRHSSNTIGATGGGTLGALFGGFGVATNISGSPALPSFMFYGDTSQDTGFYRVAENQIGATTGGTLRLTINTANLISTLAMLGPNGTASAPTYSWSNDSNSGLYSEAVSGAFSMSSDGTDVTTWDSTTSSLVTAWSLIPLNNDAINLGAQALQWLQAFLDDGSVSAPAVVLNDANTGLFSEAAGSVNTAADGLDALRVFNNGGEAYLEIGTAAGSLSLPSINITPDTNTGLAWFGSGLISLVSDGVAMIEATPTTVDIDNLTINAIKADLRYRSMGNCWGFVTTPNTSSTPTGGLHGVAETLLGGTIGGVTVSNTNAFTRQPRRSQVSGTTANSRIGMTYTGSGGAGVGLSTYGQPFVIRTAISLTANTTTGPGAVRWYSGAISEQTALGASEPSTKLDAALFLCDSGNANVQACTNSAAGSATCTDMGASFPCATVGAAYAMAIESDGGTSYTFTLKRLDSVTTSTVTRTTDLPTTTQDWQIGTEGLKDGSASGAVTFEIASSSACMDPMF